MKQTDMQNSK